MPNYNYICKKCQFKTTKNISIAEFLSSKDKEEICQECGEGLITHYIEAVTTEIEKSKDQLIIESKDEIRKTVRKIQSGDKRTIDDIYGDRPNPFKS